MYPNRYLESIKIVQMEKPKINAGEMEMITILSVTEFKYAA
jgi:hypothetical protein